MKKIFSILMVVLMIISLSVVTFNAADNDIDVSGGTGTSQVELTYGDTSGGGGSGSGTGATFKVAVPTVLPFSVDPDGNVTTATNAQIQNFSNGQVEVTAVNAKTVDGWQLVANGTDFKKIPVNSKQFTMTLNGDNFGSGTDVSLTLGSGWSVIDGQGEEALTYDGSFATQSVNLEEAHIADVVFTIAWHTV